jgi:hypothetical protein
MRPEYERLAGELTSLAAAFGHRLEPDVHADIVVLLEAIDRVDHHVDGLAEGTARAAAWHAVFAILDGAPPAAPVPVELAGAVLALRRSCERRGVTGRVARLARREMRTSETLRTVTAPGGYLRAVLREGETTAALALIIAGDNLDARFREFFLRLAGPANIVDKLLDVAGDHGRGEVRIAPSLGLYARLVVALAARLPGLIHRAGLRPVVRLGWRWLIGPALRATARSAPAR